MMKPLLFCSLIFLALAGHAGPLGAQTGSPDDRTIEDYYIAIRVAQESTPQYLRVLKDRLRFFRKAARGSLARAYHDMKELEDVEREAYRIKVLEYARLGVAAGETVLAAAAAVDERFALAYKSYGVSKALAEAALLDERGERDEAVNKLQDAVAKLPKFANPEGLA